MNEYHLMRFGISSSSANGSFTLDGRNSHVGMPLRCPTLSTDGSRHKLTLESRLLTRPNDIPY